MARKRKNKGTLELAADAIDAAGGDSSGLRAIIASGKKIGKEAERVQKHPQKRIWTGNPSSSTVTVKPRFATGGSVSDRPVNKPGRYSKLVAPEIPFTKRERRIAARQQRETLEYMGDPFARSGATILNIPLGIVLAARAGVQDVAPILSRPVEPKPGEKTADFSFKHLRQMGEEALASSKESLLHPGRDPAAAMLTVWGGLSLGATGLAKLSVASVLAREGNFLGAAKALGRKPPPAARILRSQSGFETQGLYSRNALSEAWQRTYDHYLMRGKAGSARARKLDRVIGQTERKRNIALGAIEEGEVAALAGHRLTTPQQIALRHVAEQTSPKEVQATLRAALKAETNPVARGLLRAKIQMYRLAQKYIAVDKDGAVAFSDEAKGKVIAAFIDAASVAKNRDELMIEIGKLTPETAEGRIGYPGRFHRGAEYVPATRSRLGLPTPQLVTKRARVLRLQRAYEAALARKAKGAKQSHVLVDEADNELPLDNPYEPPTSITRPKTIEEATARLDRLNNLFDALVDARIKQYGVDASAEANARNIFNSRLKAQRESGEWTAGRELVNPNEGRPLREQESLAHEGDWRRVEGVESQQRGLISSEMNVAAGAELYKWADEGKSPEAIKLREMLDEMEQLERGLTAQAGEGIDFVEGAPFNPADLGTVTEHPGGPLPKGYEVRPTDMPPQVIYTSPTVERQGAALSVARDELEAAERAALNRIEPTGVVGGGEGGGEFRVPYKPTFLTRQRQRVRTWRSGTNGSVNEPAEPGSFRHPFTGKLLLAGKFREATTKLIAEDATEAMRFRRAVALIERYRDGAIAIPESGIPRGYIAVRLLPKISDTARRLLEQGEREGVSLSGHDRKVLGKEYQRFMDDAFPESVLDAERLNHEVGMIPEKWLGGANKGTGPGRIPGWDDLNDAAKLVLIYGKIGYVPPNLLGNVVLNFMQMGFLALPYLAKSAALSRTMSPSEAKWIDALGGSGISQAIVGKGRGPVHAVTSAVANKMTILTDRFTRRASLLYEFDRRGYGTNEARRELRKKVNEGDPVAREHLIEIVRRGRENAIEYENLTPFEKKFVQRALFIYPWTKGSATFTGRYVRDHPIQAAVMYELGSQGYDESKNFWGPLPSYVQGLVPTALFGFGSGEGAKQQAIDFRGVSPVSTTADLIGMANAVRHGSFPIRAIPAELVNPVLQIIQGYEYQFNPQTRTPLEPGTGFGEYLWKAFGEQTYPVQTFKAIRGDKPSENKLVQRSVNEQRARIFGGSVTPATWSRANLIAAGTEERVGLLPKQKRAIFYARRDRNRMEKELARIGADDALVEGGLEPRLAKAWELRELREAAIAGIKRHKNPSVQMQLDYRAKAYEAEFSLAVKLGLRTRAQKTEAVAWAKQQTDIDTIDGARGVLRDVYFAYGYINDVRAWARSLDESYDDSIDR